MKYQPPRSLFRRFEILRRLRPGGSFLEVGAGDLTLSTELLEKFSNGVAIELSEDLPEIHERLPADQRARLTVHSGDFLAIDPGGPFDAVVSCEVLEHVADDTAFVQRLHQQLVPGGQLALAVPSRMKYWTVHDEIVGHLRRYERETLSAVLESAGFEDIRIVSYGFPWVNLLRLPRLALAHRQAPERSDWNNDRQTRESNHRQIPAGLATSPLRFLTQPWIIAPLAWLARPFNRLDLSDGYVATATSPGRGSQ